MKKVNDEASKALEERTRAANERMIADARVDQLPFRGSGDGSFTASAPGVNVDGSVVYELENRRYSQPSNLPQALPSLSASDFGTWADYKLRDLQSQIDRQGAAIKGLESALKEEQSNVRRLQAEKHDAVNAQRQASLAGNEEETEQSKRKLSHILQLLDQSTDREKKLEGQIEEGNRREQELRERLRDERRKNQQLEDDLDISRSRERSVRPVLVPAGGNDRDDMFERTASEHRRQQEEMQRMMSDMARRQEELEEELGTIQSTVYAPSSTIYGRSRRQAKQMEENGFVSIRKASGRRGLLSF